MPITSERAAPTLPAPITPDDAAVLVEGLTVTYRVPTERIVSLKEYVVRLFQRPVDLREIRALRDVSLTIGRGEVFGIVGRNGAGKSTLLKAISRVLRPTEGRVVVRGRLAPLLELGAGFHHELTGRENVFLNGTLLGHSTLTLREHFDEIVGFAELWDFIDAPLRTYSTGMMTRLGFAVATAIRPDILIVDEVLSVGDSAFQQKCLDRIAWFREQGTTVLVTTHNLSLVRANCSRAAWLDAGQVRAVGPANDVADVYDAAQTARAAGVSAD